MILQALTHYYEVLAEKGLVARPGWSNANVSFALSLSPDGEIINITPLTQEVQRGKKTIEIPQKLWVPQQAKRSVNICANFLCDTSSYLLGWDSKGKPKRTQQCFEACCALHQKLLAGVDSPAARAVLAFFSRWQPEQAAEHRFLQTYAENILKGGNLTFQVNGRYVFEDPAIRAAWEREYQNSGDTPVARCLVTGKRAPIARLHPAIKKIRGAQSSGASLVSYNAPAYTSYDKEQGANAPVSEYAAFAYTTALNYLVADEQHVQYIGDTAIVYWAEDGDAAYQTVFNASLFSNSAQKLSDHDLDGIMKNLAEGKPVDWDGVPIHPENNFFILGISPNAARLSVRFFLANSFGGFIRNAKRHYDDMRIIKPSFQKIERLSIWQMLQETVNQNSRDKKPSDLLTSAVLRAILQNTLYPHALWQANLLRIRAEQDITYGQAAIIKAYSLRNSKNKQLKEVCTMSLNKNAASMPYVLGRLFATLEAIQQAANPNINATIKDKYFNSACDTPAAVFPLLTQLANSHLRKLDNRLKIYYNKQLGEVMDKLEIGDEADAVPLPRRLDNDQQSAFLLGYYHQTQERYKGSKNKEEN